MAYPTGMLSLTLEDIDRRAVSVKGYCQRAKDTLAAGNSPATTILDLFVRLRQDRAAFAAAANVPGIAAYAQAQKDDAQLDLAAEFVAMLTAIDGVTTWIANNFPKDGNGFLLAQTLEANGPVDRQFTPAQTAGLRTQLDTILATIS
jgi:hypothetical protein